MSKHRSLLIIISTLITGSFAISATETSVNLTPVQDTTFSTNKEVIAKGQALFTSNCSACHNFIQKAIGPNLSGVTATEPITWLKKFIHNAPQMIADKDPRAVTLFNEYKVPMLPFTTFSDSDLNAVLAFMNTHRTKVTPSVSAFGEVLKDPIPAKIPKAGLQLMLEEVLTAPASAAKAPFARINQMKMLPGKTNRLFINDLQGKLYEMKGDKLIEVMDLSKIRPNFRNHQKNPLQARIKQLERQLEDEQIRSEAYSRMIDYAEKELNIPIRKKPDTR